MTIENEGVAHLAHEFSAELAPATPEAFEQLAQAGEPVPLDAGSGETGVTAPESVDVPGRVVPDAGNVVRLPEGVSLEQIEVVGSDLVLVQPDGTTIVIQDAALNIPTFVIGEVEIPQVALVAALEANGIDVAAGTDGLSVVSGTPSANANFNVAAPGIGEAGPVIDLLPPTALQYGLLEPEDLLAALDGEPSIGEISAIVLDEEGLPSGNIDSGYLGDISGAQSALSGTFNFDFGLDGPHESAAVILSAPNATWVQNGPTSGTLMADDGTWQLQVSDDGSFTFTLLKPLMHPGTDVEDDMILNINVRLIDKDGDSAERAFTVTVNDDAPVIGTPASATVDEDGLAGGNADSGYAGDVPGTSVSGGGSLGLSFGADGPHASAAVVLAATGATWTQSSATTGTLLADDGSWQITVGVDGNSTFTLLKPLAHGTANTEDDIVINVAVTARDADGDTATRNFAVTVNDDAPVIVTGATASVTVDEDDILIFGRSIGSSPNDGNGDGSFTGDPANPFDFGPANVSGKLGPLVSFGADGPAVGGGFGFTADALAKMAGMGLQSKGVPLTYEIASDTLVAKAGALVVFEFQLQGNGDFAFRLYDQLDHMAGDGENIALVGTGGAIDFGSVIKATDGDGDSVTLASKVNVTVTDDIPQVFLVATGISVTRDETDGNQNNDTANPGVAAQFASVLNPGSDPDMPAGYARSFFPVVLFGSLPGADEPRVQTLTIAVVGGNGASSGRFTTEGEEIFLFQEGELIVGRVGDAGGEAAFAVAIDAFGRVSVAQYHSLQHSDTGDHDETISLSGKINAVLTAADADGDTVVRTAGIGNAIRFDDDGPVLVRSADTPITVDEDDILNLQSIGTSPNDGTVDGSSTDPFFLGGAAKASGSLGAVVDFGADGPAAGGGFSFAGGAVAAMTALGLESKGVVLTYTLVGNTLIAFADGGNGTYNPFADRTVFFFTLESDGGFTFRLFDQLDHVAGNGENTDLVSASGPLGGIDFGAVIKATDGDGDSITLSGKATVTVTDDIPETGFTLTGRTVTHDETAGVQGSGADDASGLGAALLQFAFSGVTNAGDDPHVTGSGAIGYARDVLVSYTASTGADEPRSTALTLTILDPSSGLFTSEGHAITLVLENGMIIGRVVDGPHTGEAAFAIAVDPLGGVSVAQFLSLAHGNTGSNNEPVSLNGKIAVELSVTDNDGDTVTKSLPAGDKIRFLDDGPKVTAADGGITVDEDDILNWQSIGTSPNDGTADGSSTDPLLLAGAAKASGSLANVVDFGSDGPAAHGGFGFAGDAMGKMFAFGLQSKGAALGYTIEGDANTGYTLIAYVNNAFGGYQPFLDRTIFTFKLEADGDFTFRLFDQLDHLAGGSENTQLIGAGGPLAAIDFGSVIKATDRDGDSITLGGKVNVTITDDLPKAFITSTQVKVTHDETAGLQGNDTDDPAVKALFQALETNASITSVLGYARGGAPTVLAGALFGADDPHNHTLSLAIFGGDGAASGLSTTAGEAILLYEENGLIVGRVGGETGEVAFAISIDGSGHVSVAQYLSLVHGNPSNSNEPVDLAGKIDAVVTVTDHDHDTVVQSVGIGGQIVFRDDAPSVGRTAHGQRLDDEGQPLGLVGGPQDAPGQEKVAEGQLDISAGADGLKSIEVTGLTVRGADNAVLPLKAIHIDPVTQQGTQYDVTLNWTPNGAGGTYVGTILVGAQVIEAFTLEIDATGGYKLTLKLPLAHPFTDADSENDGTEIAWEDNLRLAFRYKVTDGDGDSDTANLVFKVDDDSPEIGVVSSVSSNNAPGTFEGTFELFSGADGWSGITIDAPTETLAFGGVPLQYVQVGDVLIAHTSDPTDPVFTFTVNPGSDNYVFQQFKPLDGQTEEVNIGGATAFGAGPSKNGYLLTETNTGTPLAVVSAWTNDGADVANTFGSHVGWGVNNGNVNLNEMLRFDFGAVNDFDGVGGAYTPPSFYGPAASQAGFIFKSMNGGSLTYTVYYTDGTSQTDAISPNSNSYTYSIPPSSGGKFIDYIEITNDTSNGGKISLVSVDRTNTTIDVDLDFGVTITDGDGDAVSTTISVAVTDTAPTLTLPATGGPGALVDEEALAQGSNPSSNAEMTSGSFAFTPGDGNVTLNIGGVVLIQNGVPVFTIGDTIPGAFGTLKVTAIDVAGGTVGYEYTLTSNTTDHGAISQTGSADRVFDNFAVSVEDSDLDIALATLSIAINDDGPSVGTPEAQPLTEVTQNGGSNAFVPQTLSGIDLGITWGADNNNPDSGTHDRSVVFHSTLHNYVPVDGATPLNSNGVGLIYRVSADGTQLDAYRFDGANYVASGGGVYAGGGTPPASALVFTIVLSDQGSGSYTFTLQDSLDHVGTHTESWQLDFAVVATDSDGDTVDSAVTVDVFDSVPVALPAGADEVTVDEANLASMTQAQSGLLGIDWNADDGAAKRIDFARDGANEPILPSGLSSGGIPLQYEIELDALGNEMLIAFKQGETPASPVFVVAFTEANPVYTFTLFQPLDHTAGGGTTHLTIDFSIRAYDSDGDPVDRTFTVKVVDDVPVANPDTNDISEDGTSVGGNVLANDDSGADTEKAVTNPGTIDGQYGQLLLNADGGYTYTLFTDPATQALLQGLGEGNSFTDIFNYTMRDFDGDTASSMLTFTISGSNDAPTITVDTGNPGGANDIVKEEALSSGTNPASDAKFAYGTFTLADPEGLSDLESITINGNTVLIENLAGETFDGTNGTLTVTAYNAATGVASYAYELTSATTDLAAGAETDAFTLTAFDGTASSAPAAITIEIVDDEPIAADDTVSETVTGTITIDALANDLAGADGVDLDAAAGKVFVSTPAAHGTVAYLGGGQFQYAPNGGYDGADSFTYTITDADGDTSSATVSLQVQMNSTPEASGSISLTVLEAALDSARDGDDLAAGVKTGTDTSSSGETDTAGGITFTATGEDIVSIRFADPNDDADAFADPVIDNLGGGAYQWDMSVDGRALTLSFGGQLALILALNGAATIAAGASEDYTVTATLVDRFEHQLPASVLDVILSGIKIVATDHSGDEVASSVTVNVADDAPVDFTAMSMRIENGAASIGSGALNFFESIGADGGSVAFTGTDNAVLKTTGGATIKSGGDVVKLYGFGTDTLVAKTGANADGNGGTIIFEVKLNPNSGDEAKDTYTVEFFEPIDDGSQVTLNSSKLGFAEAGNNRFNAINTSGPSDLLFSGGTRTSSGIIADKVNTSNNSLGIDDGQRVDDNEVVRIDFVKSPQIINSSFSSQYYDYDAHYLVNSFSFDLRDTSGTTELVVKAIIAPDNDPTNTSANVHSNALTTGGSSATVTSILVNGVAVNLASLQYVDGGYLLTGLSQGDVITVIANDGFSRLEIENPSKTLSGFTTDPDNLLRNDSFKIGAFSYGVLTGGNGQAKSFEFDVTATDADGDTSEGKISVTTEPPGTTIGGTNSSESLVAGPGGDTLNALGGDDWLIGGAGSDQLNGGGGSDTAVYSDSTTGVTVNLNTNTGSGGDAHGDTYSGIENVMGSTLVDHLVGDGGGNILHGLDGNDLLEGGPGSDTLYGGAGDDMLIGGEDSDRMIGGEGADKFVIGADGTTPGIEDVIADYDFGEGDSVDLSALLSALPSGTNVVSGGYVQLVADGANTNLQVDTNGSTDGANWETVAVLENFSPATETVRILFEDTDGTKTVDLP